MIFKTAILSSRFFQISNPTYFNVDFVPDKLNKYLPIYNNIPSFLATLVSNNRERNTDSFVINTAESILNLLFDSSVTWHEAERTLKNVIEQSISFEPRKTEQGSSSATISLIYLALTASIYVRQKFPSCMYEEVEYIDDGVLV